MADSQRKLVLAIIEFLQDSIANKTVASASIESLEVAIDCIGDAFGVDHTDDQVKQQLSIKPASLRTVFDVYLKTQERLASTTAAPQPGMSMTLTEEQKAKAEELKAAGNKALGAQSYDEAIKLYTQAIEINPNHIYYANRAAAYSQKAEYSLAVDDANRAISITPTYSKAYSRLAHAYFGLKQYDLAVKAYDQCLELDPNNAAVKASRAVAQQRCDAEDAHSSSQQQTSSPTSDATSPATRSAPGAGGFPGMPGGMDFASMMNNPALMNMASQMLGNGGLANLMNNPAMRQMAESMMGGGGGGSEGGAAADPMASIMNNPQLREMAQQFAAGSGGAGSPSAGSGGAAGAAEATGDDGGSSNPLAALASNPELRKMAEQFMRSQGNNNNGGSGSSQ